ncbi:conjugal transfer protein TraF [Geoalkalibacter subterraneus]|uniref:Conjugal transfer protein TraF n=1 Tax=Geoalkalibacter subterraneus TaxID=483547 RepID=A0A0B5FJH1_9BACT|nr:conjugal transfer protein TraF [Geoalkalibacter subterraneus]AJF08312.1 hypothetical protein GSUB_16440 [Geoalkalibacter subterraneus]
MKKILFFLVFFLILIQPSLGFSEGRWFERKAEGWFWYEQPEVPEEEKEPEPPSIVVKPKEKEPVPEEKEPEIKKEQGPAPLSAAWMRENLPKYRDLAVDNPTPENVSMYLYLQKYALDKSQVFADVAKSVVISDAVLDANTRRPLSSFGGEQKNKETRRARAKVLHAISKQAGLWFFYQSGCGQCEVQEPVLFSLKERYGIEIYPVSIDGSAPPAGMFKNYVVDQGQAQKLGVQKTPAIFLVRPESMDFLPLGQTTMARDMLEERILFAAGSNGWISKEMLNSTRPMDANFLLNTEIPQDSFSEKKPDEIIQYLKEQ